MKKEYIWIFMVFLFVLATRLFFTFQTENFSSDETYYTMRQVEHIKKYFIPLFHDELSYGGKDTFILPFYYYFNTFFSLIIGTVYTLKIIPNIFSSSIVLVIYLIASEFTKKKSIRVLYSFIAGFLPVFYSNTVNNASFYSIAVPITLFALFCIMKTKDDKKWIPSFIFSVLLLRATTPMVIFLIFSLVMYIFIMYLEQRKRNRTVTELIIFSTLLILWTLFVGFKNIFLENGISVLWQNVPLEFIKQYFYNMSLLDMAYQIGIITVFLGLYSVYGCLFNDKDQRLYFYLSTIFVMFVLIWFRVIDISLSLIFIGYSFLIMSIKPVSVFFEDISPNKKKLLLFSLMSLLLVMTTFIPSMVLASKEIKKAYSPQEIDALTWIKENSEQESTVLATLGEGHLVTAIAQRKNIMDSNFMFVEDVDQRLEDLYKLFRTTSQTEAVGLLNRYNVTYIYFSERAKMEYFVDRLYYTDEKCFEKLYENERVTIYKSLCVIKDIK